MAVAVSRAPVGVDIEQYRSPRADRLAERVLTERELADYKKAPQREEFLLQKWAEKEALFKAGDEKVFSPAKIETGGASLFSGAVEQNGRRYAFAVATATPECVRVFTDVTLPTD